MKKLENDLYWREKNAFNETNPEMTQRLELIGKGFLNSYYNYVQIWKVKYAHNECIENLKGNRTIL